MRNAILTEADHEIPAGFSILDLVAIGVFFAVWFLCNLAFSGRWSRPTSINAVMVTVRRAWMSRLLMRDNRIVDSTLIGHVIHSAAFFASTTTFVLAGLIGVLGSADQVYGAVANISMLLGGSQRLFEWKVVLLIAIFIYAFFKFTWALRQFTYFAAVIGGAPDKGDDFEIDEYSTLMATVLTQAVLELNAGVRAYYFAFAVFGWFIHPVVFIAATLTMVFVLARRQLGSSTARALRTHAQRLREP